MDGFLLRRVGIYLTGITTGGHCLTWGIDIDV